MSKKMLVAYYSWSCGNTEKIAEQLAEACGADLERIKTSVPYPEDYDETVAQGQDEVNAGFEPEICLLEHNPADYDVVAVGTPTWWYTMAPAVRTFFSTADLSGKVMVPFMTNGGWPGTVIDDMVEAAAGATAGPALEVQFDSTGGDHQESPQAAVDAWIGQILALLG
ncbi:flavodoxin [Paratractidigestivibacter sp.]|uniref:flavodoxin n=1 Tax=Paratractidigestivibacter sp. TaxID=2847316 RepID=UPI002ABD364D|nr:flavodoxin [Paratractidigestivibacter sp.]